MLNRHLVVSTAAGEMQVRLAGVIAAGGGDPNAIVGLCSGLGNVESSKPALALYDLAQVARKTAVGALAHRVRRRCRRAHRDVVGRPGVGVRSPTSSTSSSTATASACRARPTRRVPDWGDDPTFVISQVRSMMALKAADSPAAHDQEGRGGARQKLEKSVRASLAPSFREPFDAALVEAQRFTAMRELTKAVWVLGIRRQRPPLLAVGDGIVARPATCATWTDYAVLHLRARSRRWPRARPVDGLADSHQASQGAAHQGRGLHAARLVGGHGRPREEGDPWPRPKRLAGMGVSAGVATGTGTDHLNTEAAFARDIEPGDVLVAPFTDTPWTPLFIPAAAVVVETGGMLSHAATVAREFGIPCVVLVKDATRIIKDGAHRHRRRHRRHRDHRPLTFSPSPPRRRARACGRAPRATCCGR